MSKPWYKIIRGDLCIFNEYGDSATVFKHRTGLIIVDVRGGRVFCVDAEEAHKTILWGLSHE